MIPELFLICSMALPARAHRNPVIDSEIGFSRLLLKTERRILLVGGEAENVEAFRRAGFAAFGALTRIQEGRYQAVALPGYLPFRSEAFQQIFWNYPLSHGYEDRLWFNDVAGLVEPGGFFLFPDHLFPSWPLWLVRKRWSRLPFRLGALVIYQKPFRPVDTSILGRAA